MSTENDTLTERANRVAREEIKSRIRETSDKMGLEAGVAETAEEMVDKVDMDWMVGRRPSVLAASSLYAACRSHSNGVTQNNIRRVTGVSCLSIRERYGKFLSALDYGVPK